MPFWICFSQPISWLYWERSRWEAKIIAQEFSRFDRTASLQWTSKKRSKGKKGRGRRWKCTQREQSQLTQTNPRGVLRQARTQRWTLSVINWQRSSVELCLHHLRRRPTLRGSMELGTKSSPVSTFGFGDTRIPFRSKMRSQRLALSIAL